MADQDNELRLGFEADLSQLDSAARSLRNYIQATVDAVKAETDMNAASLQLASSQGIVAESIRDSFSNASTSRLSELAENTDKATESMDSLRASIEGVKEEAKDPSLGDALGGLNRRTINDVARGVGLVSPGAGEAVRVGNDIKEFADALPKIGEALPKLKDALGSLSGETLITGGAVAGLAVAVGLLQHQSEEARKAFQGELDARTKALNLIQTGTSEEIQARIAELQKEKEIRQANADDANNLLKQGQKQIAETFGVQALGLEEVASKVGLASGEYEAASQNATKANDALSQTNTELDLLQKQQASGAKTTADLTAAAKAAELQTEALAEALYGYAQDAIGKAVDAQIQIGDLIKNGSEQQLNDAIAAAQKNVTATKLKIDAEYAYAATLDPLSKQYTETSHAIDALQHQQTEYQKSLDALSDSTVRAYVVDNDARAKQAEIQSKQADSFQKYLDNQAKAESDYQDAQTNAYTKYTDSLQQIADNAVKAAEQALEKLEQKRSDLATKFEQTQADDTTKFHDQQLDDQIKYQREQVQLTQEHQRNLKKILEDAAAEEQNLILNRDFAGLFNLRQQTTRRIDEENDNYQTQQQQRLQAFKDQEDDEARHFAEQEAQAQLNYQRELQSAQLQYQREQQAADKAHRDALNKATEAYNAELVQLSNKHQKQLQLAYDAEVQELNVIAMGNEQKLSIEKDFANQAVAFWKNALSQLSNGNAFGAISGNQSSIPGASNRTGGGSGGAVITNNNGATLGNFNLTQNISGRDEQRIAEIAAAQTQKILADFIK
jgi:hypothetical protein